VDGVFAPDGEPVVGIWFLDVDTHDGEFEVGDVFAADVRVVEQGDSPMKVFDQERFDVFGFKASEFAVLDAADESCGEWDGSSDLDLPRLVVFALVAFGGLGVVHKDTVGTD